MKKKFVALRTSMEHSTTMEHEVAIKAGRLLGDMTFQEKVWTLAARVPFGMVTTYGDIARCLGSRAYRAVGGALNRNPFAPIVPCHRVVGSDGSLTGYGGGLKEKVKLLNKEGVVVQDGKVDVSNRFTF